jgi:excinuclease ABC subunit A
MENIKIRGARVNNLKNVDLDIPINKITCIFGRSGSGKTSIAFHTLFSESKRRFLNSFPTYLKFFSDRPAPVDVDSIDPVLPVFGLPQINPVVGTRSTVADVMNLTEQIQNLYGNYSIEKCPTHFQELEEELTSKKYLEFVKKSKIIHIMTDRDSFITYLKDTPFPSRSIKTIDSEINSFDEADQYWELFRLKVKDIDSLDEKIQRYKKLKLPLYIYKSESSEELKEISFTENLTCSKCDYEGALGIQSAWFSPYNALGACSNCKGFGANLEYDEDKLLIKNLSINDGGIKFLGYQRFLGLIDDLKLELKKEKISLDIPLEDLPKKFYDILYKGKRSWTGLDSIFKYLESKKYKPSVRIFVRGIQKEVICSECCGSRINRLVHNHYLFKNDKTSYQQIWNNNVDKVYNYLVDSKKELLIQNKSSDKILKKTLTLLETAIGLGLGHLDLTRKVKTVSAGEYQRLLLLKYLSYEGTGALFVFDEPSLGLSINESEMLLKSFNKLIDQGNTLLLVEHSEYFKSNSDHVIEMGPKSGKFGGEVLYSGPFKKEKIKRNKIEKLKISEKSRKWFEVKSPSIYGKELLSIKFPENEIVCVTGNSGSGKSSVLVNVLSQSILKNNKRDMLNLPVGSAKSIKIPEGINDVLLIDSNLNRYSSRSTVGSMTGLFGSVRKHFLNTPFAKSMGLKDGHLSANSDLGKCPNCEGKGVNIVEMQFLEDIVLKCEDCNGTKLKPLYSSLSDGEMTVNDAYSNSLNEIIEKIKLTPKFRRVWDYMKILNIDYLSLDRTVNSLSGGEKQRLYLLSKIQSEVKNKLIIMENISFGLSRDELESLAGLLKSLTELGNTVVIIDKNEIFNEISTFKLEF